MRKLILAAFLCSASMCRAAEPAATVVFTPPVHLNGAADLAQLRPTNPDHYARAVRLINAANRLCDPSAPQLQNTADHDISCAMLLLTSNPPKRALSFTLDHTRYVAIVTVTADRPQLTHAPQ